MMDDTTAAWVFIGIMLTIMGLILGRALLLDRYLKSKETQIEERLLYERVRAACRARGMSPPNPPRHDGLPDDYPCGGYFHEEISVFEIDPSRRYR